MLGLLMVLGLGIWQYDPTPRGSLDIEGLRFQQTNPASGFEEYLHDQTGIELVLIPGGTFTMGSPSEEADRGPNEVQRRVTLSRFLIGKYELSQEEWTRLQGKAPGFSSPDWEFEGAKRPAESISWNDCEAWFSETSPKLSFPTEAQWEYACRAGTTTAYCYGGGEQRLGDYGWYYLNSGNSTLRLGTAWSAEKILGEWGGQTHEVGQLKPNAFGLYDMHGNVREWCEDWHWNDGSGSTSDPRVLHDPGSGLRVFRGGSWNSGAEKLRSADRYGGPPNGRSSILGVRAAMFIPQ